jgi:hypothetical protein
MSDMDDRPRDEPGEQARPRVVDKRVSARPERAPDEGGASPVAPAQAAAPGRQAAAPGPQAAALGTSQPGTAPPPEASGPEGLWTPEQEEEARRFAREVTETPSRDWVLNTAVTLANVAAAKLESGAAGDAQLAIDALAALVTGVGARLGDAEAPLRQTVAQLQMAFAQSAAPPAAP